MSGFGDYWEDAILNHIFGKAGYAPGTIYVALSTAEPGDDGSGLNEPVGGGYARVATSANDWNGASGGQISNVNDITFPQATSSWGTISYVALFDASEGGHLLAYGAVTVPKAIESGDTVRFAGGSVGDLQVSLD